MRKFWLTGLIAVAVLVVGGLSAACGGDDDKTIDIPGGGEISTGGDIPDSFPDDFPVYDGADELGGSSFEQDGDEAVNGIWETDDSLEDVAAFYESELEDGDWISDGTFNSSGTTTISFVNEGAGKSGGILLAEADGKTTITVTIIDDASASSGGDGSGDDGSSDDGSSDDGSSDDGSSDDGSSDGGSSGSAELPDEANLEDDYPEDEIPLPDDARVTSSSSFSSGGMSSIFVTLYVKQSVDDLETYYNDTFAAAGYEDSFSSSSDGEIFLTFAKNQDDPATAASATVNIRPSDVDGYAQVDLSINAPVSE